MNGLIVTLKSPPMRTVPLDLATVTIGDIHSNRVIDKLTGSITFRCTSLDNSSSTAFLNGKRSGLAGKVRGIAFVERCT